MAGELSVLKTPPLYVPYNGKQSPDWSVHIRVPRGTCVDVDIQFAISVWGCVWGGRDMYGFSEMGFRRENLLWTYEANILMCTFKLCLKLLHPVTFVGSTSLIQLTYLYYGFHSYYFSVSYFRLCHLQLTKLQMKLKLLVLKLLIRKLRRYFKIMMIMLHWRKAIEQQSVQLCRR